MIFFWLPGHIEMANNNATSLCVDVEAKNNKVQPLIKQNNMFKEDRTDSYVRKRHVTAVICSSRYLYVVSRNV